MELKTADKMASLVSLVCADPSMKTCEECERTPLWPVHLEFGLLADGLVARERAVLRVL